MPKTPILCIVGRSGAGKTTLLEKLIPELKRRGYRVATIKHHGRPPVVPRGDLDGTGQAQLAFRPREPGGLEIDRPGKDSWRHTRAGSEHVVIVAPDQVVSIRRVAREPTLDEVAATIDDAHIILVEGYKGAAKPSIEVVRAARSKQPICVPQDLLAVVSDVALPGYDVPRFEVDDISGLADLIERRFLGPE